MPDPLVILAAMQAFLSHPAAVALGANTATALIQGLVRHFDKNRIDRSALRQHLSIAGVQIEDNVLGRLADLIHLYFHERWL